VTGPLGLGAIGQISLLTKETARAEAFYRDTLGLPHLFTYGDLAFFQAGESRLYLQRVDAADWKPGSVIYFVVDDIAAVHSSLVERGVTFASAPHLIHRHEASAIEEWMAFFRDSEGNLLAIMARVPGHRPGPPTR
jgi:predicted enzyme related to lactoylglutathione lyase